MAGNRCSGKVWGRAAADDSRHDRQPAHRLTQLAHPSRSERRWPRPAPPAVAGRDRPDCGRLAIDVTAFPIPALFRGNLPLAPSALTALAAVDGDPTRGLGGAHLRTASWYRAVHPISRRAGTGGAGSRGRRRRARSRRGASPDRSDGHGGGAAGPSAVGDVGPRQRGVPCAARRPGRPVPPCGGSTGGNRRTPAARIHRLAAKPPRDVSCLIEFRRKPAGQDHPGGLSTLHRGSIRAGSRICARPVPANDADGRDTRSCAGDGTFGLLRQCQPRATINDGN